MANVEKYLAELFDASWQLPKKKADNLYVRDYALEMDDTPDLEQELAYCYQSLIGMLSWMMEIGRVDITTELSMVASQMAIPRKGPLEAV